MALRITSKPVTARPVRAVRAVVVAPRAEATTPMQRFSAAASALVITIGLSAGDVSPAYAAPPRPTLGALEEELEVVEPAVAEAAPALSKLIGIAEVKEIEDEVRAIETATDALDKAAADSVGAETPALDKAAAPLLARIEAVRGLIGLAGLAAKE